MKNHQSSIVLVAGFAIALTLQGCEGCKKHADQTVNSTQTSATNEPQVKTPKDEWDEATLPMRRAMLTTRVRNRWQNVVVENRGDVMTVTHPGMDEESAHKIIDDTGVLAREAGLRRINFVSAGGMCQVTYTYPYCEYACSDQGYCLASESHPCLDCCLAHGYPIEQIPATRQEQCPAHTWVYDVPPA